MRHIHHGPRHRLLPHPLTLALASAATGAAALLVVAGCRGPAGAGSSRPTNATSAQAPGPGAAAARAGGATISGAQARDYVGDASCAPCHASICAEHAKSGHASTLRLVTEAGFGKMFHIPSKLSDSENGYVYRVGVRDGRCIQIATGPLGEQVTPATLALGSGRSGVTFLGRLSPTTWATLRLSYYTPLARWGFSPSQKPGEQPFALPAGQEDTLKDTVTCLLCHATVLHVSEQGVDLKQSRLSIGCERCHGAGRAHVESARAMAAGHADRITPMAPLSARDVAGVERACGECHAEPAMPPNGDVTKIVDLPRLQATALEVSRCFKESRTLSCLTCHDPHARLDERPATYETVCLSCHSGKPASATVTASAGRLCPVNPRSGCIACHMRAERIESVSTATFHNHWIRVWPKKG